MSIEQLDHLNMTVRTLDESIEWYGRVFDFKVVERANRDGVEWAVIRFGASNTLTSMIRLMNAQFLQQEKFPRFTGMTRI